VTASEISASIRARDIGDSRLTTHFWTFDGRQGDIFINVVTQNFSGDIDVYQASDLKPLTKMVMFAENGVSETGRVIYMRQPGRLLLRVQGRTPNDDPASYQIKFAGSFVALAPVRGMAPPTVGSVEDTGIKVNSVGTIVGLTPKPPPTDRTSATEPEKTDKPPVDTTSGGSRNRTETSRSSTSAKKPLDNGVKTVFGNKSAATPAKPSTTTGRTTSSTKAKPKPEPPADPLAGTSLIITLKDGTRIEQPMSEVTRFVMDHGALTIFAKDGTIHRFEAADLASVTLR